MTWCPEIEAALAGLKDAAGTIQLEPRVDDLGRVRRVGDGVAVVDGLAEAMVTSLSTFANGVQGQVLDLDRESVGCVLYGPEETASSPTRLWSEPAGGLPCQSERRSSGGCSIRSGSRSTARSAS